MLDTAAQRTDQPGRSNRFPFRFPEEIPRVDLIETFGEPSRFTLSFREYDQSLCDF